MVAIFTLIKSYWQLAVGLLLIVALAGAAYYLHHDGYVEGKANVQAVFDAYKSEQAVLVAANEKLKTETEARHVSDTISISTGYSTMLDDLNDRLRVAEAVPRGTTVQVASGVNPASGVREATTSTCQSNDTFTIGQRVIVANAFYNSALDTALQLRKLQEWVRNVCTR